MIIWPTGSSEEKTYSDMILHHAVVWTTLVVGAIGVAAAENSTALIRRSMQEEIDYSTCDEVVSTIRDLTSETAIRAALQDTVIATEQQRTEANDDHDEPDHLSFACTAWLRLVTRYNGGAIYVNNNAQVDIRGSVLSNNRAVRGNGSATAHHKR